MNEAEFENFIKVINPFLANLDITDFRAKFDSNECYRDTSAIKRELGIREKIIKELYPDQKLSSYKLFKIMKKNMNAYYDSYRTFSRFLFKMGVENLIVVEKHNKINGGYENIWRLK